MVFKILVLGIAVRDWGLKVRQLRAVGQLCSAGLTSLSLSEPALCPNPWPGWDTGIFTAASSHCSLVQLAAREVPAEAVIFHFITVSLMFSRHLSCCLCLLFGCIRPLCRRGEYLDLILLGDLACSHLSSRSPMPGCLPGKLCGCRLGRAGGFCHKTTPGCEQK